MPIFFGVVGIVLIICAVNDTLGSLSKLVKADFTGPNNFLIWLVALVVVGLVGYIPRFKPVSYAFFVLIFVGIVLANQQRGGKAGGLFANFFSAIQKAGTDPTKVTPDNNYSDASGGSSKSGGMDLGSLLKNGTQLASFFNGSGLSGGDLGGGSGDASSSTFADLASSSSSI